ncbi:amidohydrolase family protein [Natronorubrum sp. FCH18a]|uniref:amidohydrolase family protein n=1 Tax=Natronorubrum sp. FCH18a TaxID=3447018 RepID=UPI003F518901
MPEIIDSYSHIGSEAVLDEFETVNPSIELSSFRNAPRLFAVDDRIEYLDHYGIDQQVISLVGPNMWLGADPEDSFEAARLGNDEVRDIADQYPDRFLPIGNIPFLTGEYVDEARRCIEDLDFHGLQIFSNINGRMLDDEEFEPFWEMVDDLDVPVWIHPQLHDWHDYDEGSTWIYKMMGWPFDTSIAVARLIFNGVMDRYENLEIVSHHLGGAIPYWIGRVRSWYQTRQEEPELYTNPDLADLSEPLDAYFDRVYGDTAVSSQGETYPLRCGYEFFGEDNVLYGADYPFGPEKGEYWTQTIPQAIEDLDIPAEHKRKIYSENVKSLLDL